jgi:carbon monoxide dehydrogenase subunit G
MQLQTTAEFACTPEKLWAWIDEPAKRMQWMKGLVSDELTSPAPTRVGSTFLMRIKEGGKIADYEGVVTAYDRPRHLAVTLQGGAFKNMPMRVDYRLEPQGAGTRLDYSCSCDLKGPVRLFAPLFGWIARAQLKRFLNTLRRLVET